MHPDLERQLAGQRADYLRNEGRAARKAAAAESDIVIRSAHRDEGAALAALAALDGKLPPIGETLVAEVDGTIAAALPLGGGLPIADPFKPTMQLIALLEARAGQLERSRRARRARGHGWHVPAALRRLV